MSKRAATLAAGTPIDLSTVDSFLSHPMLSQVKDRYERDATLAAYAVGRAVEALEAINAAYLDDHGRVAFTAINGRVKEDQSFFAKLHRSCRNIAKTRAISRATIDAAYTEIKDLCGVRFSCPYYDEVVPAVNDLVRPALARAGYATDLQADPGC